MVIGNNQKFRVILSGNDTGTAARHLVLLLTKQPVVLCINHLVVDRYNGRHRFLYNRRNIVANGSLRFSARICLCLLGNLTDRFLCGLTRKKPV